MVKKFFTQFNLIYLHIMVVRKFFDILYVLCVTLGNIFTFNVAKFDGNNTFINVSNV